MISFDGDGAFGFEFIDGVDDGAFVESGFFGEGCDGRPCGSVALLVYGDGEQDGGFCAGQAQPFGQGVGALPAVVGLHAPVSVVSSSSSLRRIRMPSRMISDMGISWM